MDVLDALVPFSCSDSSRVELESGTVVGMGISSVVLSVPSPASSLAVVELVSDVADGRRCKDDVIRGVAVVMVTLVRGNDTAL